MFGVEAIANAFCECYGPDAFVLSGSTSGRFIVLINFDHTGSIELI